MLAEFLASASVRAAPSAGTEVQIPPQRQRRLVAGVAASSAAIVVGGLMFAPLARRDREDGTAAIGWVAGGTTIVVGASISTLVTATLLAHHRRWDAPLVRDAARARLQRRRLVTTLAIAGATALAGGLAIGLGYAAAVRCPDDQDLRCTTNRAIVGYAVGAPLIAGGAFAALSSAILLRVHTRHRHRDVALARLGGRR